MEDAKKWWESKKIELQKSIDEVLKNSAGEERTVIEIMKAMIENARVKNN